MKNLLLLFAAIWLFNGCIEPEPLDSNQIVQGVKPIYSINEEWKEIKALDVQPIQKLGKIYYKDGLIYVNELLKGIHIIDNSDPLNPVKIKFIEIIGNRDIAIKGNILYADNMSDLVTLDISNLDDIKVLGRVKNIYPEVQQNYPANYFGFFECVDSEKGMVIAWEDATLNNPDCRR